MRPSSTHGAAAIDDDPLPSHEVTVRRSQVD